jgi:predicted ArsR family transcriptional regulator
MALERLTKRERTALRILNVMLSFNRPMSLARIGLDAGLAPLTVVAHVRELVREGHLTHLPLGSRPSRLYGLTKRGYAHTESTPIMLDPADMVAAYTVQELPLIRVAERARMSRAQTRRILIREGVTLRGHGGVGSGQTGGEGT